jgi:hypothetical protein
MRNKIKRLLDVWSHYDLFDSLLDMCLLDVRLWNMPQLTRGRRSPPSLPNVFSAAQASSPFTERNVG